jgi:hypothetical protein
MLRNSNRVSDSDKAKLMWRHAGAHLWLVAAHSPSTAQALGASSASALALYADPRPAGAAAKARGRDRPLRAPQR